MPRAVSRAAVVAVSICSQSRRVAQALRRVFFFFSSRRRHTRWTGDWSSDVCSSDLVVLELRLADNDPNSTVIGEPELQDDTNLLISGEAHLSYHDMVRPTIAQLNIKIGRASCRERGEISGVAVSLKKKREKVEASGG